MIVSIASLAVLLLVSGPPAAPEGTASVTIVVDDGGTKIHNRGGTWVSVTPNTAGQTQVVAPGGKVEVAGAPDAQAAALGGKGLPAPSLLTPGDREKVKIKTSEKGPAQVVLTWTPVAGAKEYEVEFTVDNGKPILFKAPRAEAKLPPIPAGKVQWAVRSVGEGASSEQSLKRWFELQPEEIKLIVKTPGDWK